MASDGNIYYTPELQQPIHDLDIFRHLFDFGYGDGWRIKGSRFLCLLQTKETKLTHLTSAYSTEETHPMIPRESPWKMYGARAMVGIGLDSDGKSRLHLAAHHCSDNVAFESFVHNWTMQYYGDQIPHDPANVAQVKAKGNGTMWLQPGVWVFRSPAFTHPICLLTMRHHPNAMTSLMSNLSSPKYLMRSKQPVRVTGRLNLFQAQHRHYGLVTVKLISPGKTDKDLLDASERWSLENKVWEALAQPRGQGPKFLARLLQTEPDHLGFVMRATSNHSLNSALTNNRVRPNHMQVERWFTQLAGALEFLHSHCIIHGDVEPSNIMWEVDTSCTLVNFGKSLTRPHRRNDLITTSFAGEAAYLPPERVVHGKICFKSDIWALGIVMLWLYDYMQSPKSVLSIGTDQVLSRDQDARMRFEGWLYTVQAVRNSLPITTDPTTLALHATLAQEVEKEHRISSRDLSLILNNVDGWRTNNRSTESLLRGLSKGSKDALTQSLERFAVV